MTNKQKIYPWLILASCCAFAAATMGLISNGTSVFYAPVAKDLGVGVGSISLYMTVLSLVVGLGGTVLVRVMRHVNIRIITMFGAVLAGLSIMSMSLYSSPFMFYVAAVFAGIGYTCLAAIPINTLLINWFHKSLGLVTGIAFAFSGLAGAIFSIVFERIISTSGWRMGYVVMGALIMILAVPFALFIVRLKPSDMGLEAYGGQLDLQKMKEENNMVSQTRGLKNGAVFAIMFCLTCTVVVNFGSHLSAYGTSLGFTSSAAAAMISMCMIANVVSKLALGVLSDKIGALKSLVIYAVIGTLAVVCLLFINVSPDILRYAGPMLFGFNYAIGAVGLPLATKALVSDEKYASTYATANMLGFVTGALILSFYGLLYDMAGSYQPALIICLIFGILEVILLVILSKATSRAKKRTS